MKYYRNIVLSLCAVTLGSSILAPVMVEAKNPHHHHKVPKSTEVIRTNTTTTTTSQTTTFTSTQTTQILEIIRGTSTSSYLITSVQREQIYALSSLPPGIQKNLLRGKALPPGIAKKVFLPSEVRNYVNLPVNTNIIVVGSNVVLVNSVTNLVLDIISNIL